MDQQRKINVLHLRSCHGTGGGPEKTILFSAKEVDRSAFDMHIAYLKSRNDRDFNLHERARMLDVDNFVTIEEDYKFDFAALQSLLQLLRTRQIDILHAHCYKSDLYGLLLRRYHPMKLLTTAHGPLASLRYFWASQNWRVRYIYDTLDLFLLRYFDRVIMVSDTMRPVISRYGVKPDRLEWVRNAIDSNVFCRRGAIDAAFKRELAIPPEATVVGAVGRLNGEKDYPNFLAAAKLLLEGRPDLYFVIAGKGELEKSLRRKSEELGVSTRVKFLGHFQDVRRVYEIMDVYVLSSTREGLPNTVLEAMAMEVPIVATDVDGVREAVTGGREALLAPPCDAAALARGIERVLDDAELRGSLVSAAREKVEQEFSFPRRMRRIENIYREVMGRAAVPVDRASAANTESVCASG